MSATLILVGVAVGLFGLWLATVGADPLGNAPPVAWDITGVGLLMMLAGLWLRFA